MGHLIFELILWMIVMFILGFVLALFVRRLQAAPDGQLASLPDKAQAKDAATPLPERADAAQADDESKREEASSGDGDTAAADADTPASAAVAPAAADEVRRPRGLAGARGGGNGDKLQRISGVGPKLERTLKGLGFYHFDQIAAWSEGEASWVDQHLKFAGRIARDRWVEQAALLAVGKEDEFERLFGKGRKGKSS